MYKMPCHISDYTGIDPADVPDSEEKTYSVTIPMTALMVVTVSAENELDAIFEARRAHVPEMFVDHEFDVNLAEVEEL